MSEKSKGKKQSQSAKVLFCVVCISIIALSVVVYFVSQPKSSGSVNENTTIVEESTEVQKRVTSVTETTTANKTTASQTTKKSAKSTTEKVTMQQDSENIPYKSFYQYPIGEGKTQKTYSEDLRYDETMEDYRAHTGVDFVGEKGEVVSAINKGIVTAVYEDHLYGTVVEVDHGGKLVAKYCGLEKADVSEGEHIKMGQSVGKLGSIPCESAQNTHLHLEIRVKSKLVNPLDAMCKTD